MPSWFRELDKSMENCTVGPSINIFMKEAHILFGCHVGCPVDGEYEQSVAYGVIMSHGTLNPTVLMGPTSS